MPASENPGDGGNQFLYRGRALQNHGHHAREATTYDVYFVSAQEP